MEFRCRRSFFFLSLLRQHAVRSVRRDRCISEQVYTFSWSYFIITEKKKQRGTNASYRSSGNVCNLFVNLFGNSSDFFEHLWFFFPLLSARSNELFVLVKQPICWLATSDQLKKEFSSIWDFVNKYSSSDPRLLFIWHLKPLDHHSDTVASVW